MQHHYLNIKTYNYFLYLFIVLAIFSHKSIIAQSSSNFKHYTTNEGLPSSKVYQSIQDSNGFMWFATDQGVVKFDGYNFKVFNATNGLPSDDVFKLSEDKSGKIWLSTFNELGYIQNDKYAKLTIPNEIDTKGIIDHFIHQNEVHSNHFVLLPNNFLRIQSDTLVALNKLAFYKEQEISRQFLTNIGFDKQGVDWFSMISDKRIYIGKETTNNLESTVYIEHEQLTFNTLSNVFFPKSYISCFKVHNDLYLFDFDTITKIEVPIKYREEVVLKIAPLNDYELLIEFKNQFIKYNLLSQQFSTFDYSFPIEASRIQLDQASNIWVVSNNGVFYQSKEEGLIKSIDIPFEKSEQRVTAIFRDTQSRLWIGTAIGEVFVEASPGAFKKIKILLDSIENKRKIKGFGNLLNGGVAIGGDYGIFNLMPKDINATVVNRNRANNKDQFYQSNTSDYATVLTKDLAEFNSQLLLASSDGFVLYGETGFLKKTRALRTERAYSTIQSKTGEIFIGKKSGLYSFIDQQEVKLGFDLPLSTLYVDKSNTLWLGTEGQGLYYKNKNDYHFLESTDGETIKSIVENTDSSLIVLTNNNLLKVSLSPGSSKPTLQFAKTANGINIKDVNLLFIDNRDLLLGTNEGLKKLQLKDIHWGRSQRELIITDIIVNGLQQPIQSTYSLSYKENCIDISFVSLEYNNPNNVVYQYQMMGLDTTWNETKSLKQEYWFLPSGEYIFSIRAGFNAQNLSPVKQVKFIIATPWWKEWWAWALIALSVLSIAAIAIYQRTRSAILKAKARSKVEEQMSELKLQALQSQMNPHFIFNALASIQEYIFDNNQELANKYLVKFSRLMRLILESSRKSTLLLSDELNLIDLYVSLEQLRFSDKFEYTSFIDPKLDSSTTYIPSMLIQPFIENAINHGLYHKKESKGKLELHINKSEKGLIIKVTDNGIGLQKAKEIKNSFTQKEASRALEIVRERTSLYNKRSKDDINLEITELYDNLQNIIGTQVILNLDTSFKNS